MKLFEKVYRVRPGDDLGEPDFWNLRFESVDLRLHALEVQNTSFDQTIAQIEGIALGRLNDTFLPLVQQAEQTLGNLGARFTGESESAVEVGLGQKTFVLTAGTRLNYVTAEYVLVSPVGEDTEGVTMLAERVSYERQSGILIVDVLEIYGDAGGETFGLWEITLSSPPNTEHATRTDNPHNTTAAQVGAPTIAQMESAIAAEASARATAIAAEVTDRNTAITTAINNLKAGVSTAYDTLAEIAAAITTNAAGIGDLLTAIGNRLRFDDAQVLTTEQKAQAQANLGIVQKLPKNYIDGFTVAVNTGDASHDHDIAAGICRSSDDTADLVGSAMTKRTDADWAAGNNAGGRQTALGNNALCHWLAIYKDADGSVDYICKPFATALSLPTGYTKSRHIRFFRTDGSGTLVPDYQDPRLPEIVRLLAPIADVSLTGNATTTTVTVPSACPPNCEADLTVRFRQSTGTFQGQLYGRIKPTWETEATVNASNANFLCWAYDALYLPESITPLKVLTDASGQYAYRKQNTSGGTTLGIFLHGWIDRRLQ